MTPATLRPGDLVKRGAQIGEVVTYRSTPRGQIVRVRLAGAAGEPGDCIEDLADRFVRLSSGRA